MFSGHIDGEIPSWLLKSGGAARPGASLPDGAPWRTAELNWGRTAEEGSVRFPRVSITLRGRDSGMEKVNKDDGDQEKRNPSTTQGMRWSAA